MNPALLYVLGGFLVGVFSGSFKPFIGLHKPPPTQELTQAQADLTKANAAAEQARKERDAAAAVERGKLEIQIRSAQEDAAGAHAAQLKAPATPETKLALAFTQRVEYKLGESIGQLPAEQREAILRLVDEALAGKQAEFDAAMAKRDAEFAAVKAERDVVKAQLPLLSDRAVKAEETARATQEKVTEKTNEVKDWAQKKDEAERRAGSFLGALASVRHWLYGIVAVAAGLAALALYLRMGLGSVGRGLGSLQKVLPAEQYQTVVSHLDAETDRLHQWLVRTARKNTPDS